MHEKILNFTYHPGNSNHNHKEIPPDICENSPLPKRPGTVRVGGVEKKETSYTVGGN